LDIAWLGGLPDASKALYQTITIPPGATGLVVQGYIWVTSEETGGVYDVASLRLVSTSGAVLEVLATWNNNNAGSGWSAFSLPVPGNYAGQTLRLRIQATGDISNNANYFFDTISFSATVPTGVAETAAERSWGSMKNLYR
jgi:hypothetical protein